MNFFEFYNNHFTTISILLIMILILIIMMIVCFTYKLTNKKKIKTPWFEIASESVEIPESEDMGKTRLLLKRQMDYIDNFIDGLQPIFQCVEKDLVENAMKTLFDTCVTPKTHMQTCFVQSSTNELIKDLKNYIYSLIVINHIGTDKDKIIRYAKGHSTQVVGIVRRHLSDTFVKLSGQICLNTNPFWKATNIKEPTKWAEDELTELLIGLSELRYSDFNKRNDEKEPSTNM